MAKKKILIVEDEIIVANDIQFSLQKLGYTVCGIAASGAEAINKAIDRHPDLVLMDIKLKGEIDGIQTAEKIRQCIDIPIIYLTAYADEHTLKRAKITAPYGYILKPFDEREMHTVIEMAIYKNELERKINENRQWLAAVLKGIGDAVITTDKNSRVTFMNPVAEVLTGWKNMEATGKPLDEVFFIINENTRKRCENPVQKVIETGKVIGLANHTALIAKDGTERIISDSGAPIFDKNSNISGAVLVFRDITEQRKIEFELLKAQKLESIGVLAGGIAHDFNNILTAILGNITLAKMYAPTEDKVREKLIESEKACMRAKDLTQQLLTFAEGGEPIKKTVFIGTLIEDSANFALSGSNVRIKYYLPDDLWSLEVDKGQISQVINNLIINSDHAMPGGGVISIYAENITAGENQAPLTKKVNYVKISIKDQGHGITGEHLKKIFDPYFTTKQRGRGLGLATTFSIIKNHDGYITVESKPSIGTTFDIYLPASETASMSKENNRKKIFRGKGRVLVMDDEEILRDVAGEMLKSIGYEVVLTKDGAEAIMEYKKNKKAGKSFDAVILDLTVPGGMGGEETIKKLLETDPEIKAVVSSGYSSDPIMANFKKYGFIEVIAKPYNIAELSNTLSRVIK